LICRYSLLQKAMFGEYGKITEDNNGNEAC